MPFLYVQYMQNQSRPALCSCLMRLPVGLLKRDVAVKSAWAGGSAHEGDPVKAEQMPAVVDECHLWRLDRGICHHACPYTRPYIVRSQKFIWKASTLS